MKKKKFLKKAIKYSIKVAKWVEDVNEWASTSNDDDDDGGPGSNPPPPPPEPPTDDDDGE